MSPRTLEPGASKHPDELTNDEWVATYTSDNVTPINTPALTAPVISESSAPDELEECVVVKHAWLPAGKYFATYLGHELKKKYRGYDDKLVIEFSIVQSDYSGEIVRSFFIIKILADYKYSAQGGSRWIREMRLLFPEIGRKRAPSVSMLKDRVIEIQLRDAKGKGGKTLDEDMRYSVVEKMLRVIR